MSVQTASFIEDTIACKELAVGSVYANAKKLGGVGTGSPVTWGQVMQADQTATGTGSNAWVVFGDVFSAAPICVLCTSCETNEALVTDAGSWSAGSFYVETTSASQDFSWLAVGAD